MGKKLIRAKIIPPDGLKDYILGRWQEELIKQNDQMVVLYAEDGYGKTSCMTYCLEQIGEKAYCAWYLLDKRDNQAEQFITYLIATFERATGRDFWEEIGKGKNERKGNKRREIEKKKIEKKEVEEKESKNKINRDKIDQKEMEQEERQKELFLEIIYQFSYKLERLDKPFIIFFDEIQELVDRDVLDFLGRLVEYTKDRIRFFFAGRGRLPSFLIKYLSCNREAVLLTERELRISLEQIDDLLERKEIVNRREVANFLFQRTQGVPLFVVEEIYLLVLGGG